MPIELVDIGWLNKFSDKREELLNEYNQSLDKVETFNPIMHPLWGLVSPKDEMKHFPILGKLLSELPDGIHLSLVTMSSITPGMIGMFHAEPYPRELGFRRYHITLQTEPTAQFEIQDEPLYTWETGKVYEFTNPGTPHRILYPEGNDERINMMLDVFVGEAPTKETLDICYNIANGFVGRTN